MPYKSEKLKLSDTQKRNRKLSDMQRIEIAEKYKLGGCSQRDLAREYNVSRRTIQFILDPKKLEENLKRREERGGSMQYYDKDKHTKAIREHRQYKQDLYLKGELNG